MTPEFFCTADDAGLCRSVTHAIITCLESGSLQGTAVMAGGCDAQYAMHALEQLPHAVVATHLNLFEGKACAPRHLVPDLTDAEGFFRHSLGSLWQQLTVAPLRAKEKLREQIYTELAAQIDAVRAGTGRSAIRLDGHLHIHAMPGLLPVMEAIFQDFPVQYVRIPEEVRHVPGLPPALWATGIIRRELLAYWSRPLRRLAKRYGIATPDAFIGAYASGSMDLIPLRRSVQSTLNAQRKDLNVIEIMVHPGDCAIPATEQEKLWYRRSPYRTAHFSPSRHREFALLRSPEYAAILSQRS